MDVRLKICGMRDPANIAAVAVLNPAYLGFIFYGGSKRDVGDLPTAVTEAVPQGIRKTGVFVNEALDIVLARIATYQLEAVQLHGHETPEYCASLRALQPEVEIIKAFGIDAHFDFAALQPYAKVVNYFLFDTQTPAHGGSGKVFDWTLLEAYALAVPFFLSGGIGLASAAALQQVKLEKLYAIDVNSKFEIEPGLKDVAKLKEFKLKLFR